MVRHFCDWCGKQILSIGDIDNPRYYERSHTFSLEDDVDGIIKREAHIIKIPSLSVEMQNGKNTGRVSLNTPREYELCAECIVKMWGLRHDQA